MEFSLEQISLLFWIKLLENPKFAKLYMVDGNHLNCTVHEIDGELNLLNVSELETPLGIYPEAQIRMCDIQFIEILSKNCNKPS
jgi:hypothetical protein